MPAEKSARAQERRRVVNRRVRSATRTAVKKAVVSVGEPEGPEAIAAAVSALDRAATKGIIHKNNAARRKSRLMKHLNASQA